MPVRNFICRFETEVKIFTFASGSLFALLDSSSTAGRFLKEEKNKLYHK